MASLDVLRSPCLFCPSNPCASHRRRARGRGALAKVNTSSVVGGGGVQL